MALYRYIKQQSDDEQFDPRVPCQRSTSGTIASANEGVRPVIQEPAKEILVCSEQNAAMTKRAAEYGVTAVNRPLLQEHMRPMRKRAAEHGVTAVNCPLLQEHVRLSRILVIRKN